MKKLLIAVLAILAFATVAIANGVITRDDNGVSIQGFSPNGLLSAILTANSTTWNMSTIAAFSIYCPADGVMRLTATASKAGSVSAPIIGGTWNTLVTNPATPFLNTSGAGCAGGNLRRM